MPPSSSSIGDPQEHNEEIDADYIHMTKFNDENDQGYQKVARTLLKFGKDAASQVPTQKSQIM